MLLSAQAARGATRTHRGQPGCPSLRCPAAGGRSQPPAEVGARWAARRRPAACPPRPGSHHRVRRLGRGSPRGQRRARQRERGHIAPAPAVRCVLVDARPPGGRTGAARPGAAGPDVAATPARRLALNRGRSAAISQQVEDLLPFPVSERLGVQRAAQRGGLPPRRAPRRPRLAAQPGPAAGPRPVQTEPGRQDPAGRRLVVGDREAWPGSLAAQWRSASCAAR